MGLHLLHLLLDWGTDSGSWLRGWCCSLLVEKHVCLSVEDTLFADIADEGIVAVVPPSIGAFAVGIVVAAVCGCSLMDHNAIQVV